MEQKTERTDYPHAAEVETNASMESTRIYLHLADDWLASQYRRPAEAINAQLLPGNPTRNGFHPQLAHVRASRAVHGVVR